MQHQPIWTSTKNITDVTSEDHFLSCQSVFKRLENNAKVKGLNPSDLDLRTNFDANTCITLPHTFISKVLASALGICDSGMDLELKHILIRITADEVQVFAGTADKLYVLKEPIDKSINPDIVVPFEIGLSSAHVKIVSEFISKAFGEGRCEIGAKLEGNNAATCLLFACYAPEFDGSITSDSDPGKPLTKAALFRLPREIGESPLAMIGATPDEVSKAVLRYTAVLSPRIKGLFVKQTEYVELSHVNGLLEMCFPISPTDTKPVRASLGCPLQSTGDLPTPNTPFVALKSTDFSSVMSYAKTPVTLDVWFNSSENSEVEPCSMVRLTNEMFTVFLAQGYIVGLQDAVNYITKKKGKLSEATQSEAVEKALKDNKTPKEERIAIMKSFSDGLPSNDAPDIADTAAIIAVPTTIATDDSVDAIEDALNVMTIATRANSVDQTKKWPPEKVEDDNEDDDESSVDLDKLDVKEMLAMVLDKLDEVLGHVKPKSKPKKFDPDAEARNTAKDATYELLEYIKQVPNVTTKTSVLRQCLSSIRHTSLHLALSRLQRARVIERLQKGSYYIPADIVERVTKYRSGVPMEAIVIPEEFIDKGANTNAGI